MTIDRYEITAAAYFRRASANLSAFHGDPAILFYSALEFRYCIERLLFEYMILIKLNNIQKSMEKLYLARDLKNKILEIEPEFVEKLEFINFYLSALDISEKVFIPDLGILNKYYGRLGNYLHLQKRPEKTCDNPDWWTNFTDLLPEIRDYLGEIFKHPRAHFELNEEGWKLFDKFKTKSTSEEEIIKEIRESNIG